MWLGLLILVAVGILVVAMNLRARRRGFAIPGKTPVRCSQGHLFETTWIEGGSLKAVRLGPSTRYQRCPVCERGRLIHPVRPEELSEDERAQLTGSD